MAFNYKKTRLFWSIWAFGYYRQKDYRGRTYEFQLFIGPVVITWWK
jgi:hypothetical protein